MRPDSAAERCEDNTADDDPSWHIGEMRPRGFSAPSSKHCNRYNNGYQLRVYEAARSPLAVPVSHALRKVGPTCIPCVLLLCQKLVIFKKMQFSTGNKLYSEDKHAGNWRPFSISVTLCFSQKKTFQFLVSCLHSCVRLNFRCFA